MKLVVLLLFACALNANADILANGDFSQGRAHWRGDAQEIDSSNQVDLTTGNPSQTPGVVIHLKKDKWRKIYQTFTARDAKLYYSITFQLSADYKTASPIGNPPSSRPDLSDVQGAGGFVSMPECFWDLIIIGTPGHLFGQSQGVTVDTTKSSPQTVTGSINIPSDLEANLILVFPPGEGSIKLLNISLSPKKPEASP